MSNAVNVDFVTKVVEIEVNDNETESLATIAAVNAAARAEDAKNVVVDNLADSLAAINAKTEGEKTELDTYTGTKKTEISAFASDQMQTYADSAAASAQAADTTAAALTAFLETKETLTAPAVDITLSVSGAAADAKVTGEYRNVLSYTYNPTISSKKSKARNRFLSLQGSKPLLDSVINSQGKVVSGTGSGNNWVSDYVKIPADRLDVTVIAPGVRWHVAFYDKDFNFISFLENKTTCDFNGSKAKIFSMVENAEYLRFGFYSNTGYSDDKFYKFFKAFSILTEIEFEDNEELAPHLPWGMKLFNSSHDAMVDNTTLVGTADFVMFNKPVIVTPVNGYKIAATLYDFNRDGNEVSDWFTDNSMSIFIPAGLKVWIGVRPIDANTTVYLPENICEQVSIRCCDEQYVYPASAFWNVKNGYTVFGRSNVTERCMTTKFNRATEDLLIKPTNGSAVYTLVICRGDIDFTDESKWTIAYSIREDKIIPKDSWYMFSIGVYGSNDEASAKNSFTIEPLHKNFYSPMYASFISSLIADIGTLRRRISELENLAIPSYYVSHINEKISTINNLHTVSNDQFVFITDVHLNGYRGGNPGNSKALINKIANETTITKVFNGGDLLNRPSTLIETDAKTKRDTITLIEKSVAYSKPDNGIPQFLIVGNHDSGVDYPGGQATQNAITVDEYMACSGFKLIKPLVISDEKSDTQYYFENGGIRYIIINPGLRDVIPTNETFTDTWRFIAMALSTMASGTHAIIMPHVFMNRPEVVSSEFTNDLITLADAYNNRGSASYTSASANFHNCGGRVAAFIAGHAHQDFSFTTDTGIPVIITTTDNGRAQFTGETITPRTIGTIDEQAFDVFSIDKTNRKIYATRIGAGTDREFSY